MRRVAALTLIVLAGALICAYLASPWIVARLAHSVAETYGFSEAVVRIERPGSRNLLVREVRLVSPSLVATGVEAQIDYTLGGLLRGRIQGVVIGDLTLVLSSAEERPPPGESAPSPELLFPVLPLETIRIERLRLEVPALGFVGEGSARWGLEDLALMMRGVAPEQASRFAFEAELSKTGEIGAVFRASDSGEADILNAAGQLADDQLTLQGRFDVSDYALALVTALAGAPVGEGRFTGVFELAAPWPVSLESASQQGALSLSGAALTWSAADGGVALDLSIASLAARSDQADAVLTGTVQATLGDVRGALHLPAGYSLQYRDEILRGGAGPRIEANAEDVGFRASLRAISLQTAAPLQAQFEADATLTAEDLTLTGRWNGQLAADRGKLDYAGDIRVADVEQAGSFVARYQLEADAAAVTGEASFGLVRGAGFKLAYDMAIGSGHIEAALSHTIRKPLAAALITDWTGDYDLDGGVVDAALTAEWQNIDKVACTVTVKLKEVAAYYDDYRAVGLAGTLLLRSEQLGTAPWQLAPARLTAASVDVGFPIEDVQLDLAGAGERVRIASAQANLLGGRIYAAPFEYDLGAGNARIELTMEDVDLAAVLALEGDDIAGSGRLDGRFPLTLVNNAVSMQAGQVRALPPGGTIRLAPALARGTGQPGLDFALVALQDFRFSDLTADVDYAENGDMRLGVKLKGHNPAVEKGRAIQYNLNITENVPTLLESLRLQDEVRAGVERKLNR